MRRFAGAVALAVVTAGCFGAPGSPDSIDIEIPDTVVRGEPGSVHVLKTVPVAPQAAGRVCAVAAQGINNDSVHPDSDLLVRSDASEVVIPDVERAPNVRTDGTGPLTLGAEISVAVRLGPDEVFSGGLVVELDCPPRSDLNRQVSGPFTGTTFFHEPPLCPVARQVYDATYEAEAGGVGTFHIDNCLFAPTPENRNVYPVGGSFDLTAPNGATLTGTVTGTEAFFGGPAQLDFTLTVTGRTGQFRDVTGTIGLDGTSDSPPNNPGTFSGTLVGSLQ